MNILVGYDGSDSAKRALNVAKQHATAESGEIEVVHVIARSTPLPYGQIQKAEQKLEWEVKDLLVGNQFRWATTLLVGIQNPAEQIVNFAETINADVVIIGFGKRSKMGKFVFGSTTQYVVLNAPCPVIVVK